MGAHLAWLDAGVLEDMLDAHVEHCLGLYASVRHRLLHLAVEACLHTCKWNTARKREQLSQVPLHTADQ